MRVGYYPGCSLEVTAKDYDESSRAVLGAIGLELVEIPDWNCCGASPAHVMSEELSLALPFRNLLQAESSGMKKILAPCPACYAACRHAHVAYQENPEVRARLDAIAGKSYANSVDMRHLVSFLFDEVGEEKIKSKVKRELKGIKLAAYYGCLLRLPGADVDDIESPTKFESVIKWLGAESVGWAYRTECCGASLAMPETEIVVKIVGRIIESAKISGARAIVTVCPLCQANLEMRQAEDQKMPILYLPQVMGIAFGLDEKLLGLHRVLTSWRDAFAELNLQQKESEQSG